MLTLPLLLAVLALPSAPQAPEGAPPAPAEARSRYAEGQVWEYRTRPQDRGSLIRIQRIEQHPDFAARGPVYHISVIGLRFAGEAGPAVIGHLPVSSPTLDASVTRLVPGSTAVFPDSSEGIGIWRENRGGVFDVPLAEIIDFAEQAVLRAGGGKPQ